MTFIRSGGARIQIQAWLLGSEREPTLPTIFMISDSPCRGQFYRELLDFHKGDKMRARKNDGLSELKSVLIPNPIKCYLILKIA